MADVELQPVLGGVENGHALKAPALTGDTELYVLEEKSQRHWICQRLAIKVGSIALASEVCEVGSGDAARGWVETDWQSHRNYIKWALYMGSNPPR